MTRPELSTLLAQLRAELAHQPEVDDATRAALTGLGQDIRRVLHTADASADDTADDTPAEATATADDEPDINVLVQTLEAKLEAGHPYLVGTLRDLMDRLGKMGI